MESQYYRTFIALPIQVEPLVLEARRRLMSALEGERISWVEPSNYHVTLRFLGDTGLSDIKRIGSELQAHIQNPGPTRLEISRLSSFGPHKRPRVIWLGFGQSDFFSMLKEEVDRALANCGIPLEEQAFRAHLTLARVRSLHRLSIFHRTIDDMSQQFNSPVLFEKLIFFRSILGSQGPEYKMLKEIPFR